MSGICVLLLKELRTVLVQPSMKFCPLEVNILKMPVRFVLTQN